MTNLTISRLSSDKGFSLVEIMVGLVIGLLATLVIVNVFSVFEQQKRATTGNSDAQTNGTIALYSIQRDAQLAGFGLPVYDKFMETLNCGTENDATTARITSYDHDNNPGTQAIGLSPVVITDGGLNGSDSIALRYSNSSTGGIDVKINLLNTNSATVTTTLGCETNHSVLIMHLPGSASSTPLCEMRRVTAVSPTTVNFTPNTLLPTLPASDLKFACLGQWHEIRFAVNVNNELTRSGAIVNNVLTTNPVPVVADIVNMQAQYGISAVKNSNLVTQWVNATAEWNNISNSDLRSRIKAIRVAVVARNGLIEPNNVTVACSSLTALSPTGLCSWAGTASSPAPAINLAATDPNWARYRYRVYESVIPLRNVIFARDYIN